MGYGPAIIIAAVITGCSSIIGGMIRSFRKENNHQHENVEYYFEVLHDDTQRIRKTLKSHGKRIRALEDRDEQERNIRLAKRGK